MNYTEEKIIEKAKEIMKDLREEYYFEDCTDGSIYQENEEVIYGKLKGEKISYWTVFIKSIFENTDHLLISDETGEPIYYHNFNMMVYEIEKDKEGKYYRVE